jgi:hypothetical protein
VPLRRGVLRSFGDDHPRCVSFRAADMVDRCSNRALPAHDLHATSGVEPDGEVYGAAWITAAALPAPPAAPDPSVVGAILGLAFATDETAARYWLAACARAGIEQPALDDMWSKWLQENTPLVIYTDPRKDRP